MAATMLSVKRFATAGLLFAGSMLTLSAAATLSQQINPPEANVGDQVTVTFTLQNGGELGFQLPRVDGLQTAGSSSTTNITFVNGTLSSAVSQTFALIPQRPGDFTIPSFDIHTRDGQVLHTRAMKLHVVGSGAPSSTNNSGNPFGFPGTGPVVMPPSDQNATPPPEAGNNTSSDTGNVKPPLGSDGRPVKVFMVVTAKTTDAYVGETIPLRIEFYIRMDSIAQQDSLPTIKGSDFLMNDLSVRPAEDVLALMNETYHRETWLTAISAPKSGDFPLQMERDTYWMKDSQSVFADPLGNFFGARSNLAHGNVAGNNLIFHVHSLPEEGRPADFTGAIGQFKTTGNASPVTVNVGDPAYLDFNISGEGNFDSVRCPVLATDPAWKSYTPSSQIHYADESHTQGDKTFHQAIIPRQNGTLPLPAASFSYFDPTAKKYVTIPIPLPPITVTGTPLPAATTAVSGPTTAASSPTAPSSSSDLAPNRLELGALRAGLEPAYRQPWFLFSQGALLFFTLLATGALFLQTRLRPDPRRIESARRLRSLHELEEAMSAAVAAGDASAFFSAARQAVQLRWSSELGLAPERVTAAEIGAREPRLAETAVTLFQQADEVIYSGRGPAPLDLTEWERCVREDLLQAQPAGMP
jgi:hypothetical protein